MKDTRFVFTALRSSGDRTCEGYKIVKLRNDVLLEEELAPADGDLGQVGLLNHSNDVRGVVELAQKFRGREDVFRGREPVLPANS
jgi:hypothetical protein